MNHDRRALPTSGEIIAGLARMLEAEKAKHYRRDSELRERLERVTEVKRVAVQQALDLRKEVEALRAECLYLRGVLSNGGFYSKVG